MAILHWMTTVTTTLNDANFTQDKLHNFQYWLKFATLFRSSWFDWQGCNEFGTYTKHWPWTTPWTHSMDHPMDLVHGSPLSFKRKCLCLKYGNLWTGSMEWSMQVYGVVRFIDPSPCFVYVHEFAKFIVNFGNFKRTSETVCQKFCETHLLDWYGRWQYWTVACEISKSMLLRKLSSTCLLTLWVWSVLPSVLFGSCPCLGTWGEGSRWKGWDCSS